MRLAKQKEKNMNGKKMSSRFLHAAALLIASLALISCGQTWTSGTEPSVSAGGNFTMFLKADGTLWATGENTYGQLGDGTTTDKSVPVPVMTGVRSVSAGNSHTMILKTDGRTGSNIIGQLGDGTT